METPIALHSVAHRVSHQIPAESEEMSRQNRATPPQIKVSHLSPDPPVALSCLIRSRQGTKGGCRGGLVEGIAAPLGSENGSRYRGVSQLQSHQSRYSVQLSCAQKGLRLANHRRRTNMHCEPADTPYRSPKWEFWGKNIFGSQGRGDFCNSQ